MANYKFRLTNKTIAGFIGWTATGLAIAGVLFNNAQSTWCFPLWLASNFLTFVLHAQKLMIALCVRDAIFFVLAGVGWWFWLKDGPMF